MEDFDNIFSEKLYNHKTAPSSDLWGAMDEALDREQRNKKKIIYWRVAAAVLLLMVAGGLLWINDNSATMPAEMSKVNEASSETVEALKPEKYDALALESATGNPLPDKEEQANHVATPTPDTSVKFVEQVESEDAGRTDQPDIVQNKNPDRDNVEKTDLEKIQPLQPALADLEADQPAFLAAIPEYPETVTIIYKPGEGKAKVEMGKPLEMLADIKNGGISFAEIRSAKSELLAKVFLKLDNEIIP